MDGIFFFKLINGENIIAEIATSNDTQWIIKSPLQCNSVLNGAIYMSDWIPFNDAEQSIVISKERVLVIVAPSDVLLQLYVSSLQQLSKMSTEIEEEIEFTENKKNKVLH